jgi:hypothetical protein
MAGPGSSGIAASPSQGNTTTPRNLLPSRPPRVTYGNGMLSIVADNSTLADVLSAVRQKTGAYVEAPPSAASERIVISIGPAPANAVLTSLLNGSRFDYIILGSTQAQGAPQRLILREKQGSAQASAASPGNTGMASNPSRNIAASPVNQLPPEAPEAEEESPPEADIPEEVQPDVQQQQPAAGQPGQQGQPQVKTPEQLLEELKQMQQQQQLQQQQQGNQPGSQPQSNESVPRAQTGDESQQEQQQQMQPQQPADNEPPPDF